METYALVSKDVLRKTITEDIDLGKLKADLAELNKQAEALRAEPDEIVVRNDEKFRLLDMIEMEKIRINEVLTRCR